MARCKYAQSLHTTALPPKRKILTVSVIWLSSYKVLKYLHANRINPSGIYVCICTYMCIYIYIMCNMYTHLCLYVIYKYTFFIYIVLIF